MSDRRRTWTAAMEASLREMDAAGVTQTPMARALGKTKNAVAGKRRRLKLPRRHGPPPKARPAPPPPRAGLVTLAPLPCLTVSP